MNDARDASGEPIERLKQKSESTGTSTKDQKVLWSRAAGRCSMAECRDRLTMDKSVDGQLTLGEMCHIVGEKKDAARGISILTLKQRNAYSNLILLCRKHHRIIDEDASKYPVEELHRIKSEHEEWVNETLSAKAPNPDEVVFADLIDNLTSFLHLEQWGWFIDNAARQLIHRDLIDAHQIIMERWLATIWPTTKPELAQAMRNLMEAFMQYMTQYGSGAAPKIVGSDYFGPDESFKQVYPNPRYDFFSKKQSIWARTNFAMLCLYVVRLNEFAAAVRQHFNPMYFIKHGQFTIVDSFGTHLGSWGMVLLPELAPTLENIALLEKEQQEFEAETSKKSTTG